MTYGKKALALMLCIIMCISLFPFPAAYAEEVPEEAQAEELQEETAQQEGKLQEGQQDPENLELVTQQDPAPALEQEQSADENNTQIEAGAAEAEAVVQNEEVTKTTVVFVLNPTGATVSVYTIGETGEKLFETPTAAGSYELVPGDYFYDVSCENYTQQENQPLTVTVSEQPVEVPVVLTAVAAEPAEGEDSIEISEDETAVAGTDEAQESDDATVESVADEEEPNSVAITAEGSNHVAQEAMDATTAEYLQKIQNALTILAGLQKGKYFANTGSDGYYGGENENYWQPYIKKQVAKGDYTSYLSTEKICNHNSTSTLHCLPFGSSTQCKGYKCYLQYVLFGAWTSSTGWVKLQEKDALKSIDINNVRPGDVFHLSFGSTPHYYVVWKVENGSLYVAHANHANDPCVIMYGIPTYYSLSGIDIIKQYGTEWWRFNDYSKIDNFVQPSSGTTTYTINFNGNGGSNGASVTIAYGGSFTIPSSTRQHYTLNGWNVKRSDNKWFVKSEHKWMTESEISSGGYTKAIYNSGSTYALDNTWTGGATGLTFTFYANWTEKEKYTVAYNANGGSSTPTAQTKYKDETLPLSGAITRSSSSAGSYKVTLNANGGSVDPSSQTANRTTSYTFKNWNTSANGSGTSYNAGANYTKNEAVTLYAQWNSTTTTAAVTLPTPTRSGYEFKGWGTSASATSGVTGKYTPSGNVTLYAVWQAAKTYTVTFNANGGTGAPAAQTKTHDKTLTLSSVKPTRTGSSAGSYTISLYDGSSYPTRITANRTTNYTFKSWNTNANGSGTTYNSGASYTKNEAVTLYAQWNSTTTTESVTLPLLNQMGYTLLGWATSADATKAEYQPDSSYTANGNVSLYAVWQKNAVSDPVEEYVRRCYQLLMGREGDAGGVNYWVKELKSGKQGGASIVDQFISSKEFVSFGLSNRDTVARIYQTMLNREPDAGGLAYWQSFMDDGMSPHYIVSGFSGAQEFKDLCSSYGIQPGRITLTQYRDKNNKVTQFVNRNYSCALERQGDANGLNYWCEKIIRKQQTPQQCAQNFVFSAECVNRNLSNQEFVEMLYHLYMGRDADQGGLNHWLGQLSKGMTRQAVANSFANSKEFKQIVASYGL